MKPAHHRRTSSLNTTARRPPPLSSAPGITSGEAKDPSSTFVDQSNQHSNSGAVGGPQSDVPLLPPPPPAAASSSTSAAPAGVITESDKAVLKFARKLAEDGSFDEAIDVLTRHVRKFQRRLDQLLGLSTSASALPSAASSPRHQATRPSATSSNAAPPPAPILSAEGTAAAPTNDSSGPRDAAAAEGQPASEEVVVTQFLAVVLNNLACILQAAGRYASAIAASEDANRLEIGVNRPSVPTMLNLCVLYISNEQYNFALDMCETALATLHAAESPDTALWAAVLHNRGVAEFHLLSRFGEGSPSAVYAVLQEACTKAREAGRRGHQTLDRIRSTMQRLLEEFGPQVIQRASGDMGGSMRPMPPPAAPSPPQAAAGGSTVRSTKPQPRRSKSMGRASPPRLGAPGGRALSSGQFPTGTDRGLPLLDLKRSNGQGGPRKPEGPVAAKPYAAPRLPALPAPATSRPSRGGGALPAPDAEGHRTSRPAVLADPSDNAVSAAAARGVAFKASVISLPPIHGGGHPPQLQATTTGSGTAAPPEERRPRKMEPQDDADDGGGDSRRRPHPPPDTNQRRQSTPRAAANSAAAAGLPHRKTDEPKRSSITTPTTAPPEARSGDVADVNATERQPLHAPADERVDRPSPPTSRTPSVASSRASSSVPPPSAPAAATAAAPSDPTLSAVERNESHKAEAARHDDNHLQYKKTSTETSPVSTPRARRSPTPPSTPPHRRSPSNGGVDSVPHAPAAAVADTFDDDAGGAYDDDDFDL